MSNKIIALLTATVAVGLSLGYAAPSAPVQGKAKPAQTKACCGQCDKGNSTQTKACCGHCGMKK